MYGVRAGAQFAIKDVQTGEVLRSALPQLKIAGDLLGIRSYPSLKYAIKRQKPIH